MLSTVQQFGELCSRIRHQLERRTKENRRRSTKKNFRHAFTLHYPRPNVFYSCVDPHLLRYRFPLLLRLA